MAEVSECPPHVWNNYRDCKRCGIREHDHEDLAQAQARIRELEGERDGLKGALALMADTNEKLGSMRCTPEERAVLDGAAGINRNWLESYIRVAHVAPDASLPEVSKFVRAELARRAAGKGGT